MCFDPGLPTTELRALLSDAIATARRTRDGLDDALHAMLSTPSLTPAVDPPVDDKATPVPAGASDPIPDGDTE